MPVKLHAWPVQAVLRKRCEHNRAHRTGWSAGVGSWTEAAEPFGLHWRRSGRCRAYSIDGSPCERIGQYGSLTDSLRPCAHQCRLAEHANAQSLSHLPTGNRCRIAERAPIANQQDCSAMRLQHAVAFADEIAIE